jgi:DNA-binding transcriptional regulator of glucitol operon
VTVRKLFTFKWVLLHVLFLVAFAVCVRLGWWQWDRAKSHSGTMQNFGYALQWPLFAGFVVLLWWRAVRDVLHPKPADEETAEQPTTQPADAVAPVAAAASATTIPALPTDDEDPEVAAYNRYLASLYARDEERARQRRARRTAGARGGSA